MRPALLRRFVRDESGVALLEFAIFATLLLVLVFGAMDFGRALFTANRLTSAAREGARYAATLPTPNTVVSQIKTRVVNSYPKFGNDSLTIAEVEVTCPHTATAGTCGANPQDIQVRISHAFVWITHVDRLLNLAFTGTLHGQATFRWEGS